MSLKLTASQKEVLVNVIEWYKTLPSPHLTFGGYAGTGKTTLTAQFRKLLHKARPKDRVAFCAYTGKAARVLDATLKNHQATVKNDNVSTIHSLIYAPLTSSSGQVTGWKKKKKVPFDLIIVDEASMVDEEIWHDLQSFDTPIWAIGDHGQLPPIQGQFNLMENPQLKIEEIHRQAADNPIIKLSMIARTTGSIDIGDYGQGVKKLDRYDPLSGQEVEDILKSFQENTMILTGYNHTRVKLNQQIRQFQDIHQPEPQPGDHVICLKNNWEKGIYNGMSGIIQDLAPAYDDDGEHHWYQAEIQLEDRQVYTGKISKHQFNEMSTINEHEKLPYSLLGDLFDFGYALTVHKAQGSQAESVLLFEERNKYMSDEDWRRWLYTGVTRAQENLTIVGQ